MTFGTFTMASNKTSLAGYRATGAGNLTLLERPSLCTLDTCELDLANFNYIPTLEGNAAVAAIFGVLLLVQIFFGVRYKTWGFMSAMIGGLALELVGYVGRIMMHDEPFNNDAFLMSLVCLTIAPAFLTAAIYLCLARIVHLYGAHLSYFKPATYTIVFCTFDFICLILQAVGGAIASITNDHDVGEVGRKIMLAGLLFQVVAISIFMVVGTWFGTNVLRGRGTWDAKYERITHSLLFKAFLVGLTVAVLTIQTRSIYRCVELWDGFNSDLFQGHEDVFMVLEAVMIIIACLCLSGLHPALCFQGAWDDANFRFRSKNQGSGKSIDEERSVSQVELRDRNVGSDSRY